MKSEKSQIKPQEGINLQDKEEFDSDRSIKNNSNWEKVSQAELCADSDELNKSLNLSDIPIKRKQMLFFLLDSFEFDEARKAENPQEELKLELIKTRSRLQ